jgi:hypothetical protein
MLHIQNQLKEQNSTTNLQNTENPNLKKAIASSMKNDRNVSQEFDGNKRDTNGNDSGVSKKINFQIVYDDSMNENNLGVGDEGGLRLGDDQKISKYLDQQLKNIDASNKKLNQANFDQNIYKELNQCGGGKGNSGDFGGDGRGFMGKNEFAVIVDHGVKGSSCRAPVIQEKNSSTGMRNSSTLEKIGNIASSNSKIEELKRKYMSKVASEKGLISEKNPQTGFNSLNLSTDHYAPSNPNGPHRSGVVHVQPKETNQ